MGFYQPEQDSYFLSKILIKQIKKLKKIQNKTKFLEIGAGSGIQLETALKSGIKKQNIFSCDINPEVVKLVKGKGFNCIKSDLFSKFKEKDKFVLIIFNPPYLPEHKFDKGKDTTGGKKGSEIIIKFLKQAKKHLNKEGKILLLTSSLTPVIDFKRFGYEYNRLANKKLFFEELYIWELKL